MNVSIIFVNFNTCKMTLEAIASVYSFTKGLEYEIIVVDNDSKDDSVIEIQKHFPEVILVKNKKNIGFGQANNVGMKIAKGKYYFLLNTDTYLLNNAIQLFFEFMENSKNLNIAVAGGQLYKPNGDLSISHGPFPNFKLFVKGSFWRHFYKKEFYANESPAPKVIEKETPYQVDYVSGANFFVRAEVIKKVGGFNKGFFMYFEETELSYRIKKMLPGSFIVMLPEAKIVHIGQGSTLESIKSVKFQLVYLKSRSLYFKIQNGYVAGLMVYLRGLVTIFFNR